MACRTFRLCRRFISEVMSLNPSSASRSQVNIHPWTIRHDSVFKAVWDWLILILVMYTAIEIPYTVVFSLPYQRIKDKTLVWFLAGGVTPLHVCNLWVDLMFIIDILINFRSTYVEKDSDEIISHPRKIVLHYLKSWFVMDFFAAIPFEFMINPSKEGAATLMGLFKTARLLRLVRVARKLDRYSEYGLAVVVLLTCLFMLLAHWLACIWHAIGHQEISNENGWIWLLALDTSVLTYNSSDHTTWPSVSSRYITSLYFTLSSLTTVGFGNVAPNTNTEKAFSVCVMIVGALFYAAIFGNMTAIIQRLYSRTSRFHRDLRVIEEFAKFHKVPPSLRDDLEEYFRHEWIYTKGVDVDNVLKRFPECLQADVCHHLQKKLFNECSAFATADEGCLRALSIRFTIRHFLPGHYVIKQGDAVSKLYFIVKGTIEVIKNNETCLVLGKGDTISCDYSSINSAYIPKANASLLIQSHTEIHFITWSDLLMVLKAYTRFREDFLNHLELAYNLGNNEHDEYLMVDDPSRPRIRTLLNARHNLKSNGTPESQSFGSSKWTNANGKLPQQTHSPIVQCENGIQMIIQEPVENPMEIPIPAHALETQEQLRELNRRLSNIDKRVSNMEDQFAENFQKLFEILEKREESKPEAFSWDGRSTNI